MKKIFLTLLILSFLGFYNLARGAEPLVYFHSPEKQFAPNSEFTLTILLDSEKPVNAGSFNLLYDNLEFLGFNDANSIFDIWQTKPNLEETGRIHFVGGARTAFSGKGGVIMQLNFRVLNEGKAKAGLVYSDIYLADGNGTQIKIPDFYASFDVNNSFLKTSLEKLKDETPPTLSLKTTKAPDGTVLAAFEAGDKESGVDLIEARIKKFIFWSEWRAVKGTLPIEEGTWLLEIRARNGNGGYEFQRLFFWKAFFLRIALPFLAILLILSWLMWYTKKRKNVI